MLDGTRMRPTMLVLCFACGCWPRFGGGGGGGEGFTDSGEFPPPGPQPVFGPTVTRTPAPPPISGGTLAIAPGTPYAIAADPDRDRIYVVDLSMQAKVADIALQAGDE